MHPSQINLGLHFPDREAKFFDLLVVLPPRLRYQVRHLQVGSLEGLDFIVILKRSRVSLGAEDVEDPKPAKQSSERPSLPKKRSLSLDLR